jgi:hypothetical protein
MFEVLLENWSEVLLAVLLLADTIVSLTPTDKDDKALGYIRAIVLAVLPKKGDADDQA